RLSMFKFTPSFYKSLSSAILIGGLGFSSISHAEAPGGPDCGWGNMMFEGDSGPIAHIGASIFNSSSGNAWIGMLLGTNGCSSEGVITYGGKSIFALQGFMDEVAVDIAQGEGEALNALSVVLGIPEEKRPAFNTLMHSNFDRIFPTENIQSEDVISSIHAIMKEDEHFRTYAS